MIERLNYIKINPQTIVDIGSGLNIDAIHLKNKYPKANIYKIDIAIEMLKQHAKQISFFNKLFKKQADMICANATNLPISSQSTDLVWSNITLQYIPNIEEYFKEIRRILKINGTFLITSLGVDSLKQLREIGLSTYNFPDMHVIGDILVKLGFSNPVTDVEYITLEYTSPEQLITDIRTIGCGAVLNNKTYLTKEQYNSIHNKLLNLTQNGTIPLTLELFYAHAWKDTIQLDLDANTKIIQFSPKSNIK